MNSLTRFELEICVAGCVLIASGENIAAIDLDLEDFLHPPAKAIICAATEARPIDMVLVRTWATNHGMKIDISQLSDILNAVPTSKNLQHYLDRLKQQVYKDQIESLRREVQQRSKNEDLVELSREIAEREAVLASKYLDSGDSGDLVESAASVIRRIDLREDNEDLFATGLDIVDELNGGGILPEDLIILAARPSNGKTAFALQIASDCARKVAFFSMEMSKSKLAARLLASTALRNTKIAVRKPSEVPHEIRIDLLEAASPLLQISSRIKVFDQADQTLQSIRRIARKQVEEGAELIIIDYLQLITCEGDTRDQALAAASRGFKNMAKELHVPVLLLSQLSRACESEKRLPRLHDLRECGAIENDADIVWFLHDSGQKTEDRHKKVIVIQAKGRDSGVGFRTAIFNADHQRFYRISTQEEPV